MADRTGLPHRPRSITTCVAAAIASVIALLVFATPARSQDPAAQPSDSPYVGADVCRNCHLAAHDSWTKSKHASSFVRLSETDAASAACIGCHATGLPSDLRAPDGRPHLPGTQCEACHGPGRAHAAEALTGTLPARGRGITARPQAEVCERCHNKQSPRFQGFVYGPMSRLVHAHPGR